MSAVERPMPPGSPTSPPPLRHLAGVAAFGVVLAANDPRSTRIVYSMVIGLALVGIAFIVLAVWLIRRTRVDPPVLAPLERMGERSWQRSDPTTQRRMLDQVRPEGATPLVRQSEPPRVLAEFDVIRPVTPLTDLGPGLAADDAPAVDTAADTDVALHDAAPPSDAPATDEAPTPASAPETGGHAGPDDASDADAGDATPDAGDADPATADASDADAGDAVPAAGGASDADAGDAGPAAGEAESGVAREPDVTGTNGDLAPAPEADPTPVESADDEPLPRLHW